MHHSCPRMLSTIFFFLLLFNFVFQLYLAWWPDNGFFFFPIKGLIIERIRSSVLKDSKKRFIYLGDGKGDYCPSLKLGEGDYVMPRKNLPLWELISSNPLLIKAEVHEWSYGEELARVLLHLINTAKIEDNTNSAQLISADCKFQTIPLSSHDALPHALPVPH